MKCDDDHAEKARGRDAVIDLAMLREEVVRDRAKDPSSRLSAV